MLQARALFESLCDPIRVLQCDLYLVNILNDNGEDDEERECRERCIVEARELGVPSLLGQALSVSIPHRYSEGDLAGAWRMAEECEQYLAQGGDDPLLLHARYYGACILLRRGDFEPAQRRGELLLQQAMRSGDLNWIALGERLLVSVACALEDYECAEEHVVREIDAFRRLDPPLGVALCQLDEGSLARAKGELGRARRLLTESLTASRAAGGTVYAAAALGDLGVVALDEGDLQEARRHFSECLRIRREIGENLDIKMPLECLGGLAALEGQPVRALRLLAAGQRLREATGNVAPPAWRRRCAPWIEKARQALGPERADAAWAEGQAMTLEEAVEYALKDEGLGISVR